MGILTVEIEEFIRLSLIHPILDVRSPSEYKHAHIPLSKSLPLFDDQERTIVGTIYKNQSRENAIKKGLEYFGRKMSKIIEDAEEVTKNHVNSGSKTILIHCWRGGMRSAGIAWLLDLYGFKVITLKGGYKSFRNWVLDTLLEPFPFIIIGGYTGSGKTEIIHELTTKHKYFTIYLEGIACHKGSAFGAIGQNAQPTQEMFENLLAFDIYKIKVDELFIDKRFVFIEDESQRIGTINLPQGFWINLKSCPTIFLEIPFKERLEYITNHYGKLDKNQLAAAITRIQKRLGGLETKLSLGFLLDEDFESCFSILLNYYDKLYKKALERKSEFLNSVTRLQCDDVEKSTNTLKIISILNDGL
jgi:tRNA 2-selenouridine synthase